MVGCNRAGKDGTFMKAPVLALPCYQQAACGLSKPALAIAAHLLAQRL